MGTFRQSAAKRRRCSSKRQGLARWCLAVTSDGGSGESLRRACRRVVFGISPSDKKVPVL